MSAQDVVETYFRAWSTDDPAGLDTVLADDVAVTGPLGHIDGAGNYRQALGRLFSMTRELHVVKQWTDGPDIITFFEFTTHDDRHVTATNWLHVDDDRVTRVRVAFDPRPILPTAA